MVPASFGFDRLPTRSYRGPWQPSEVGFRYKQIRDLYANEIRHLPSDTCYVYAFPMGVRQNRPLGFGYSDDFRFTPSVIRLTLPSRFVLPGPIGTPEWHAAEQKARGRFNFAAKLSLPTRDLDYDLIYQHIVRWEAVIRHMYLDTHKPPLVTVGAGNMLPNEEAAKALPFVHIETGMPATEDEIVECYRRVASMPGGLSALKGAYKQKPNLEITVEFAKQLAITRLKKEFIPSIRKHFRGFNGFPLPAREAIIDIAYNGGVGNILHNIFLRRAIESNDWKAAARIVGAPVAGENEERIKRKAWRRRLFEMAHFIDIRSFTGSWL